MVNSERTGQVLPKEQERPMRMNVLVVDDHPHVLEGVVTVLGVILRAEDTVYTAGNGQEAMQLIEEERGKIDVVWSDRRMPIIGGEELLAKARKLDPTIRYTVLSSTETDDLSLKTPEELREKGIDHIHKKGIDNIFDTFAQIREALEEHTQTK